MENKRHITITVIFSLVFTVALAGIGWTPSTGASRTPQQTPDAPDMDPPEKPGKTTLFEQDVELVYPALAPVAPALTGGPDHYGYTYSILSPAWIDATGGKKVFFPGDDDAITDLVDLGFNFRFYENTYSQIYISTNGLMTFGEGNVDFTNTPLPIDSPPNNLIAPFWDDLSVISGSNVYVITGTNPSPYFVVQWDNVVKLGSDDRVTFQAVLYANGDIRLQYQQLSGILNEATVGIEDREGLTGLLYLFDSQGLKTNEAILFKRPDNSARVKFLSQYESGFNANSKTTFPIDIRNTGDFGTDTYNLSLTPLVKSGIANWEIKLYNSNGITLLTDTNGDSVPDTGPVPQGATKRIYMVATAKGNISAGDYVQGGLIASSSLGSKPTARLDFQSAVPAPFAQVYAESNIGTMIDLSWPSSISTKKVDAWFSGSTLAMVETTGGGYIYSWERNNQNIYNTTVTDIDFVMLSKFGAIRRPVTKLTDNSSTGEPSWQISDRYPSIASAPNGFNAVVWLRSILDLSTIKTQTNIYLQILNSAGDPTQAAINITNNSAWGGGNELTIPDYRSPRLAALGDNRFVVAWVDYRKDRSNIVYAIYDQTGNLVKAPTAFTNSTSTALIFLSPNVTSLTGNRALITYSGYDSAKNYTMYYYIINSNGSEAKPPTLLANTAGVKSDALQLDSGNIVLAWTNTASQGGIAFAILNSSYAVQKSPEILLVPGNRPVDAVSITKDKSNHVILTWLDSVYSKYIFYALLDGNGNKATPPMFMYKSNAKNSDVVVNYSGQSNAPYDGGFQTFLPLIKK